MKRIDHEIFGFSSVDERRAVVRQSADKDTACGIAECVACVYADTGVSGDVIQQRERTLETGRESERNTIPAHRNKADRFERVAETVPVEEQFAENERAGLPITDEGEFHEELRR